QEHTVEEIYQELYNAQIEEKDEEENKNEIENQLNVNLDEYNEKDLDDEQGTTWENLNLLEIIDLEMDTFKDTDDNQVIENSDNENELK
ncbi:6854_t:CDS:1, partial [Racocetra persica]